MTGGPLTCWFVFFFVTITSINYLSSVSLYLILKSDLKLVNWEDGNYRVTDYPNPRGEVHVGGSNVAVGYYKQPEKTQEEFYEENGRHWFRTGDIGEINDKGMLKVFFFSVDL